MGGFWEAKILDFRTFFIIFSMLILKSVSEEQKISTRGPKKVDDGNLGLDSGGPQAPGERKREGSEALRCRRYRKKLGEAELARILKLWSSTPCTPSVGGGALRAIRRAVSRWPVKLAKYYPSEHHVRVVINLFSVWPVKLAKYYP